MEPQYVQSYEKGFLCFLVQTHKKKNIVDVVVVVEYTLGTFSFWLKWLCFVLFARMCCSVLD